MSRYRAVECGGARVGLYTEGGGDRYREGAVMNVLDPLSPEWTRAEDDEKLDLNDPRVTMKFQGIPSVPVSEAAAGTILVSSRSIAADIEEFAHAAADTEEEAESERKMNCGHCDRIFHCRNLEGIRAWVNFLLGGDAY
ncbi:uncharacterized protein LOC142544669 isoform X2 [Primulina tabacum]|uniref:uncharacterized protein LOC142544669 isoform X2 n=1 Tax=Primulina tabacum TaxID=48773 RepID=UPI003F5AD945